MMRETGRLWFPFKEYLAHPRRTPALSRLIRGAYQLELLSQRLTDGWKVSHEMFAFCFSAIVGPARESGLAMISPSRNDAIWAVSIVSNEARVGFVTKRLMSVLGRDTLFKHGMPEPDDWDLLTRTTHIAFSDTERPEALAVLRALRIMCSRSLRPDSYDIDAVVETARKESFAEAVAAFKKGGVEHQAALSLCKQFVGNGNDALKAMVIIGLISNLYAPHLPPRALIEDSG